MNLIYLNTDLNCTFYPGIGQMNIFGIFCSGFFGMEQGLNNNYY